MKRIVLLALAAAFLSSNGCGDRIPQKETPPPPPPAQVNLAPLEQKMTKLETEVAKLRKDLDMVMAVRFPKAKKK